MDLSELRSLHPHDLHSAQLCSKTAVPREAAPTTASLPQFPFCF